MCPEAWAFNHLYQDAGGLAQLCMRGCLSTGAGRCRVSQVTHDVPAGACRRWRSIGPSTCGRSWATGRLWSGLQVISEEGNMPNIILSVSAPWPPWFHEEGFTCQDQISNGGSPLCGLDGAASRVWF